MLRHEGLTFSQLVRALTVPNVGTSMGNKIAGKSNVKTPRGGVFGTSLNAQVGINASHAGKRTVIRGVHESSVDPIAWRGKSSLTTTTTPNHVSRKWSCSPCGIALLCCPPDDAMGKASPQKRNHVTHSDIQNRDTGASATLYGRNVGGHVEVAAGARSADIEKFHAGGKAGHKMPEVSVYLHCPPLCLHLCFAPYHNQLVNGRALALLRLFSATATRTASRPLLKLQLAQALGALVDLPQVLDMLLLTTASCASKSTLREFATCRPLCWFPPHACVAGVCTHALHGCRVWLCVCCLTGCAH